jgi:ERCC4-type nuclease
MNSIQTILIDSREQKPLAFPKSVTVKVGKTRRTFMLRTKVVTLDAGDYCLAEFPNVGGCERKANNRELYQNLITKDRTRFKKAWQKFVDTYSRPFLMIEQTAVGFTGRWIKQPKYVGNYDTYDALLTHQLEHPNVQTIWTTRGKDSKKLGAIVARTLIIMALDSEK